LTEPASKAEQYRSIPSVDAVLRDARIAALAGAFSLAAVTALVRGVTDEARNGARNGKPSDSSTIVEEVLSRASRDWRTGPRLAINATGVVLHTNLGRAPLSRGAAQAAAASAVGYSDLEFSLDTGKRGSRTSHISGLIAAVTGAEAGFAVNNNASAVLLTLSALADGREVIVSRGESVEIGGGFRVPDVMRQSGATLIEVGTTNRTYDRDYDAAVTERTTAILKVHPSNFSVQGFTHTPELSELVSVGRKHSIPVLNDLGSGSLVDTRRYGMQREPTVQDSVVDGAALTLFSGDKLLGGPQAGIICGDRSLLDKVAKHPLTRAVRIDKMTLAALSATLLSYLRDDYETEIPIWRMISASPESLETRAIKWRDAIQTGEVRPDRSTVGGGSLPGETLPTSVLAIRTGKNPDVLTAALRSQEMPVIGRIQDDELLLDPRTVLPEQDKLVAAALAAVIGSAG
jgi:L-seryl-tRNA(Ser) seleniumtransferase